MGNSVFFKGRAETYTCRHGLIRILTLCRHVKFSILHPPPKKFTWPTYILSILEGSARYRCLLTGHLLTCACQRCAAPLRQYNTVNCDLAVGAQCVGIGPEGNRHL